jgi:hypothetical protein
VGGRKKLSYQVKEERQGAGIYNRNVVPFFMNANVILGIIQYM